MIPFGYQTVTRQRGTDATDEGGAQYIDWADPDEIVLTNVNVQPFVTTESDSTQRDTITDTWRMFADGVPDVQDQDRIVVDSKTYEVDGEPMTWPSPIDGSSYYTEIKLRRFRG